MRRALSLHSNNWCYWLSKAPPAATYHVGPYAVLVWNKNLLARLRTLTWCNEGWPWNTPALPCPPGDVHGSAAPARLMTSGQSAQQMRER